MPEWMQKLAPSPAAGEAARERTGIVAGGGSLLVLCALDLALGSGTSLVGTFAIAPLTVLFVGGVLSAVVVAATAVAATAVIPGFNMDIGHTAYYLRLAVAIAVALFTVLAALALRRSRSDRRRLELLDDVGQIATGALPLDETLRLVTQRIAPAIADLCMVDAISEPGLVRLAVGVAPHPEQERFERAMREREPTVPERFGHRRQSASRPEPYLVTEMSDSNLRGLAHDRDDLEFLQSLGVRSVMTVPLVARGHSIGALTMIAAWSGRVYRPDDVHFAEILAGRVALALDNAGLFSDLESVERRMENVMQILDEAVVIHDAGGELLYANPAAARTMGYSSVEELVATPTRAIRDRYVIRDEDGGPVPPERLSGRRVLRGEEPEAQILRSIDRETGEERWHRTRARPITGPEGGVIYAVTVIEDVTEPRRAEFAQRLLARTGELLSSSTDYRGTLREVAALAVPEFADWCGVNLPSDDGMIEQVAVAHRDPDKVKLAREFNERFPSSMSDPSGSAEVMRTGESQLVEVTPELLQEAVTEPEQLELLEEIGMRSAMLVPMQAGDRVVGVLSFVNEQGSRRFDATDLELAREIGRRAGIAVDNARLAEDRAEIARVLQRGLLPPALPAMPGWDIATMYRPAGELNEVGGDFYDAFEVEGGWMIVIGDVVGRGAAAASLTALARYTIRTAGMLTGDPGVALSLLNDALCARAEVAPCTVAIITLSDAPGDLARVSITCGGHPLPLLVRGTEVTEAGEPGPILGALGASGWASHEISVQPGDQIVVYTDGLVEARGRDERFGQDRLQRELAGVARPVQTVSRVEAALEAFTAGEADDDAALIAILRLAGVTGIPAESAAGASTG